MKSNTTELVPLSTIADIIMGQSPKGDTYNKDSVGTPLLNGPTEFTDRYPKKIQWTTAPTKLCKKNDVLLCVRGSSTGRINISNDEYCIGRGLAAIRKKSNFSQEFLIQCMQFHIDSIIRLASGTTFPNLDRKTISSLLVPKLATQEQQKIAEILSTVDKKIDLIDQKIAETEKLKIGLMQKLFSEGVGVQDSDGNWQPHSEFQDSPFGRIPATWRYDSVRSLVSIKSPKYDPKVETDSFPCIELEHLSQGSGEILGTVNSLNLASTKNCFTKGEVLFGKLRPYLKKFAQPSFQGVCSSEIWVMKTINEEKLHNNFLYFFVQHERFINETNKSCGTKMPRADWKVVSELQLPVPSIEEQLEIANILSCIDTNLGLLKQQKAETQQLKKGLMQKLLTGEWRVPLDNPEAA
ncbi:restriction endonuclease subunit S [Vibrio owensii]|uniref:restriction endonuclease subunit S n=1 Tax=Vibrio owensii TaxID=696485 RepID=UPI0009B73F72|nr:restriction endonuclease subunit S [Vibrio owensii]